MSAPRNNIPRFGLVLPTYGTGFDWKQTVTAACLAEELGYDSLWVPYHLVSPTGSGGCFEGWTVLSALGTVTSRIELGTFVLCNQFRHPSLVSKMVSTLDHLSCGRSVMGIGSCSLGREHDEFGIEWGSRT
ncbi:MAG: LLM class flavin-dependent oxidoreductase [Candidatus Thorarchaeota archaeon]